MKKILVITFDFPPVGGPGVQRVLKFVKYLPLNGWSSTVITSIPERSGWWLHANRRDWDLCNEIPKDVQVYRVDWRPISECSRILSHVFATIMSPLKFLGYNKKNIREGLEWRILFLLNLIHPEPLMSFIFNSVRLAARLSRREKFDIIFTTGPPHGIHWIGFFLKRLLGIKWVVDLRDPWLFDESRKWMMVNILSPICAKFILNSADTIITISKGIGQDIAEEFLKGNESRVFSVYNGYDYEDIPKLNYKSTDPKILHIHYNGNLNAPFRSANFLFKALQAIKSKDILLAKKIKVTFTGLKLSDLDLIKSLDICDMVFNLGHCEHRISLENTAEADVLLLLVNGSNGITKRILTGKVFEYMGMGKTILALLPQKGDLVDMLRDYAMAELVEYNNLPMIIKTIENLIYKKENNGLNSCEIPHWVKQYTRQAQTNVLAGILNNLAL